MYLLTKDIERITKAKRVILYKDVGVFCIWDKYPSEVQLGEEYGREYYIKNLEGATELVKKYRPNVEIK